jgi:hypothetical protein
MDGFKAFTSARFDWTASLSSIWTDSPVHVPELHAEVIEEVLEKWGWMADPDVMNPLGTIIVGEAGSGKTHLVSALRKEIIARGGLFLLGDMTDVRDFWETVQQGIINSLLRPLPDGTTQLDAVIDALLARFGRGKLEAMAAKDFAELRPPALENRLNELTHAARKVDPDARHHVDEMKALMLLGSSDPDLSQVGLAWLGGLDVSEAGQIRHALPQREKRHSDRVKSLSWVISQYGPVLFAVDQLDAITSEARAYEAAGKKGGAALVYHQVVRGMMELWDALHRTLIVATSLETNWKFFQDQALAPVEDRYGAALRLRHPEGNLLETILGRRLQRHYESRGFEPPYPSYPFRPEAFRGLTLNPRQLLRRAEDHRTHCRRQARVEELSTFVARNEAPPPPLDALARAIDERFSTLMKRADGEAILGGTDREHDLLLESACRCLAHENPLPESRGVSVDVDFGSDNIQPLHARIRVIDHDQGDRERHFSLRFIQHPNAVAFQARLKRALTESGVSSELPFRRLLIVRSGPPPTGPKTKALVEHMAELGGALTEPDVDELRALHALTKLLDEAPEGLEDWLREQRRVSRMKLFRDAVPYLFGDAPAPVESRPPSPSGQAVAATVSEPAGADGTPRPTGQSRSEAPTEPVIRPAAVPRPAPTPEPAPKQDAPIVLGAEASGLGAGEPVALPVHELSRHVSVVAAAGSGKTVFVRRLVEEAALRGIPAIVIDVANDLVRFGDRWPDGADPQPDRAEADRFFERTETVVWTPGWQGGNPLSSDPLPDFGPLLDDPDELNQAIDLALDGLVAELKLGASTSAKTQQAILRRAIEHLARHGGGSIQSLVSLLQEPPVEVTDGFAQGGKLADKLATSLNSAIELNPLLRAQAGRLEFETLFGYGRPKTRISVVNLSGLSTLDQKRAFVGRFITTLFTWIKKVPATDRPKGLVVIDEAKDFAPATAQVASRQPILRLAAQARKYGLGMIMATQEPKSIHNQVVSNCSTQIFGKALSPAAQDAVRSMLAQLGGQAGNLAALKTGEFHCAVPESKLRKIRGRLCLSHHPSNPPGPEEVKAIAARHRDLLGSE